MPSTDRLSYDTAVSGQVQADITGIVGRLESTINDRSSAVAQAMSDFQADNVSDRYAGVEQRWTTAADQVREIITLIRTTLAGNDKSATDAIGRAGAAVDGIG